MITIIVPVYKAEKYLRRCVDSILAQTYSDFELLLIDDGSPDNCGAICDEYAAKDSRVRVFHKENGGVSSARNLGLENAKGEWIAFVDSDDWIEYNYLDRLIRVEHADLVIGGVRRCSSSKLIKFEEKQYVGPSLVTFINSNKGYRINPPWGNLLRHSIIKEHSVFFDEKIRFGEDAIFNLQYLCLCKNVWTISNCGYNYWDYDISSGASLKYKLSIDEVHYTLSQMQTLNSELGRLLGGTISSDADYAMMLGMIPVEKRCEEQMGEEFYAMCKDLNIVSDRVEFYNHELCSPIFQGIAKLKHLYEKKEYVKVKELYTLLHSISREIKDIKFRCKDFYLWYALIKLGFFSLFDCCLRFFCFLKRLLKPNK